MQRLEQLQVLELSGHVAGAFCGKLLAGFGADVVRIAGGHDPALDADAQVWFHTGKRLADQVQLQALLARADIIIDAWGFGALAAVGYDLAALRALNPRAVVCQITPYGQTGPKRSWQADDITLYAEAGLMRSTGDGRRAPLNAGPRICELTAGMNAYFASLACHMRGDGETIDLAIVESSMENIEIAITECLVTGKVARRNGDQHAMVPWRTYPCADGEVAIVGGPIRHWLKAAEMFGAPELLSEPLRTMAGRIEHRERTEALMRPWLQAQTRHAAFAAGQAAGLAWAPLLSLGEALNDPQHAARGFFVDIEQPGTGRTRMPGAPFRAERCPWTLAAAPVESMSIKWSLRGDSTVSTGAGGLFDGLRVLDFTHDWAGPHAARMFADYGAEVIKIEYPRRLDGMRGGYVEKIDAHPRFWQLHRGKQSLTLDLKREADRAVLDALVRDTDLIIENSRPGVMERKGYGYAHLQTINPKLILLSMSAFGATGPYASYCGYGGTLEAVSGLQSLTSYDANSRWFRVREMDVLNGIMGACAAMTALWQRKLSGRGQWIDLSECETTAWFAGEHFAACARLGQGAPLRGNRHAVHAPQGCYATTGEDRWLTLCVRSDAQWRALAGLIGGAALADDGRYASAALRRDRHDELDVLIGAWAAQLDSQATAQQLQALGIAAASVASVADISTDGHLAAREWIQTVGSLRLPGLPFRLATSHSQINAAGPKLGADNARLFAAAGRAADQPTLTPADIGTAYDIE
jgi:crotonobetainyl-CoA:carnitine CoA-transferase CaiB-like acyl-CoA transferase